jgi:hypothetical protein
VLVCRDGAVAPKRFGIAGPGAVYTRTGRPFFETGRNAELLARIRTATTAAALWDEFDSDRLLFDAELLPWSVKAGSLIADQYAAVGAAAQAALPAAMAALNAAVARGIDVGPLLERTRQRASDIDLSGGLPAVLLADGRA